MRNFLLETALFLALLSAIICGSLYFLNKQLAQNANFKLNNSNSLLIFGHSHPECAYNDSLIADCSNLAESGEAYLYTAAKLEQVLAQNPTVQTVWVEVSNNQMQASIDNWITAEKYLSFRYNKYLPFFGWAEYQLIAQHNSSAFFNELAMSIKSNGKKWLRKDYNFANAIGKFYRLEVNKVDSFLNNPDHLKPLPDWDKISLFQLVYLQKMVMICQQYGKKLYFIRSPMHKKCPHWQSESIFKQVLAQEFGDVAFLDFSIFNITNAELADLEHLNAVGAARYSVWIDKLLKNGLLDANDKNAFIKANLSL